MLRAREVLVDCEVALADFVASGPTPFWRSRLTALLALMRAVGHVLHKVDAGQNVQLKNAIDDAWGKLKKSKPEPRIFWEFMEEERNNVLKAYEFGARLNITVRPGTRHLSLSGQGYADPSEPTTYESFMQAGVYGGRDAVEVFREAIDFWQSFLGDVESAAGLHTGPSV
jgi:hypothetical protein